MTEARRIMMLKKRVQQHTGIAGVYVPKHESTRNTATNPTLTRGMSDVATTYGNGTDLETSTRVGQEEETLEIEDDESSESSDRFEVQEAASEDEDTDGVPSEEELAREWEAVQRQLADQLSFSDAPSLDRITRIAGVNVAYQTGTNHAVASIAVFSYPSMVLEARVSSKFIVKSPYIPGYAGFRDMPGIELALEALKRTRPEALPQLIVVDGNGRLHPRGCGVGSQLGLVADIPCFGIATTLVEIDGLSAEGVPWELGTRSQGGSMELWGTSGTVWGAAMMTAEATNPIYVSAGHKISLETALEVTRVMWSVEHTRRRYEILFSLVP